MIFRKRPIAAEAPAPEVVEITLEQLKVIENVIRRARAMSRELLSTDRYRFRELGSDLVATLYQRAGAASVVEQDVDRARVPFFVHEFDKLDAAVDCIDSGLQRTGDATLVRQGRELMNQCNALLGRARAIQNLGGTAAFVRAELGDGETS
jgi:hypothetical protein